MPVCVCLYVCAERIIINLFFFFQNFPFKIFLSLFFLFCFFFCFFLLCLGLDYASKIAVAGLRKHKMEFDLIYTSVLMRAHQTVDVIVKDMNYTNLPVRCHWRLNERHYGNLTGYNKREMADKFGEKQVKYKYKYQARITKQIKLRAYFEDSLSKYRNTRTDQLN